MFCGCCGAKNVAGVKFCVKCGANLTQMITPAKLIPDKPGDSVICPEPLEAVPAENIPVNAEGSIRILPASQRNICPQCQLLNSDDYAMCKKCGAKLFRKCPFCGMTNQVQAKYCQKCGSNTSQTIDYQEHINKAKEHENRHEYEDALLEYKTVLIGDSSNHEAKKSLKNVEAIIHEIRELSGAAEKAVKEERYEDALKNYQRINWYTPNDTKTAAKLIQVQDVIRKRDIKKLQEGIKDALEHKNFDLAMEQNRALLELEPNSAFTSGAVNDTVAKEKCEDVSSGIRSELDRRLRGTIIILIIFFGLLLINLYLLNLFGIL